MIRKNRLTRRSAKEEDKKRDLREIEERREMIQKE